MIDNWVTECEEKNYFVLGCAIYFRFVATQWPLFFDLLEEQKKLANNDFKTKKNSSSLANSMAKLQLSCNSLQPVTEEVFS